MTGNAASALQQIRRFSSGLNLGFPLQPLKQRKTVPIRNPRRPHLPDPLDTDPTAQRFRLADHPRVMLVIREPSGMPNLTDPLIGPPPRVDPKTLIKPPTAQESGLGLSHPVLSQHPSSLSPADTAPPSPYQLPPPLRAPKVHTHSLTPEQAREVQNLRLTHSVSQLSRKFNIPRLLVSILGPPDPHARNHIYLKHSMRQIRKQARWSIPKIVRRQEKISRRSLW